jgi:hypothetical protein
MAYDLAFQLIRLVVESIGLAATRSLLTQCEAIEANKEAERLEQEKFRKGTISG